MYKRVKDNEYADEIELVHRSYEYNIRLKKDYKDLKIRTEKED